MDEKTGAKPKAKRGRMKQFYFQHSPEVRALSEELRAQENLEFAGFNRMIFNAGLEAKYGIRLVDNKPILPEKVI
ncbi:MAG: hypothetical protein ABL903_08600 [Methylococcales bacterium]